LFPFPRIGFLIDNISLIRWGRVMLHEWESLSSDELFELHQAIQSVLREKLIVKRQMLEARLRQLNQQSEIRLKGSGT
jgi:hypothetical protein